MNLDGTFYFLPNTVTNLDSVRMQIGLNHINADQVLSMTTDAMLHGSRQMIQFNGQQLLILKFNQIEFTLSSDGSTVFEIRHEDAPSKPAPKRLPITELPSSQTVDKAKNKKSRNKCNSTTKTKLESIDETKEDQWSDLNNIDHQETERLVQSENVYVPKLSMKLGVTIQWNDVVQSKQSPKSIAKSRKRTHNASVNMAQSSEATPKKRRIERQQEDGSKKEISENVDIRYNSPKSKAKAAMSDITMQLADTYTLSPSRSPMRSQRSMSPALSPKAKGPRKLKRKIADILQNDKNKKQAVIQETLEKLPSSQASNVDDVRIVMEYIIENAVNCKPRLSTLCAQKIADLCWMMREYCESVWNQENKWKWSDEELNQMMEFDDFEMLRELLLSKFGVLQIGNDADKLVNIMVIMAEMYNEDLLCSSTMVEVMDTILCGSHLDRVSEGEIDGLLEIFKRCWKGFRKSKAKREFAYYLNVLHHVCSRKKSRKHRSVEFKIKQINSVFAQDYVN